MNKGIILPVLDIVLLPNMDYTLSVNNISNQVLTSLSEKNTANIALFLKEKTGDKALEEKHFHKIGVTFKITKVEALESGFRLDIKVAERVLVNSIKIDGGFITGEYEVASDILDLSKDNINEVLNHVKRIANEISENFSGSEPYLTSINKENNLNKLIGYLAPFMPLSTEEKYSLIHTQSIKERSLKFVDFLLRQKEAVEFQLEIAKKFSEKANKRYRESALREQLKAIQEELKEGKEDPQSNDYLKRIEEAHMPSEVKEVALEELDKLENQSPNSPDYNVIKNYLDLLTKLPWKSSRTKKIDLEKAKKLLDQQHYGLSKIKERIIQHLAVMKLKKDKKGSILLLVGPPGTGKTSLGKSIAEALDRKYVRLSLGGIRDEAEIRGHRKTYVGAMPGRIIDGIKKAGVKNPVMILDEVDKLISGLNGDPASALLEVLDPEQNNTFTDHYLNVPYDLSEVFFIATANSLDTIPRPLLDRMEVIQVSSYTANEKFHIAKEHLLHEVLNEHGIKPSQLKIDDDTLKKVISDYTMEAGVRGLKKQLSAIARAASEKIVLNDTELPFVVSNDSLEEILGRQVSRHDKAQADNPPGVVTGLAWTSVGGEILFIEATHMIGNGQIILTGQLGDVMKESARISLSLLKSRLPINSFNFKERDLHIHVPSGSVPKDGPSAGITLFTALASLVTGIKVNPKIAMTGEITLRGAVLAIGGLKEKLIAADRAGIKKALIPKDNVIDLKEVPEEVKNNMEIVPVETIEDVLRETLGISLPKPEYFMSPDTLLEATFNSNNI